MCALRAWARSKTVARTPSSRQHQARSAAAPNLRSSMRTMRSEEEDVPLPATERASAPWRTLLRGGARPPNEPLDYHSAATGQIGFPLAYGPDRRVSFRSTSSLGSTTVSGLLEAS